MSYCVKNYHVIFFFMAEQIIEWSKELVRDLEGLSFSDPVTHVYNPLKYAWESHKQYLERFCANKKRVLFLGMNPGPYGMAQTGVPFGEIPAVSDWMGIHALVGQPENMHPKRPVLGFGCSKSEVSGRRLWGLCAEKFPKADDFFKEHYVTNYCPLVWMGETGRNITPDKVSAEQMKPVEEACDRFLIRLIEYLSPEFLVGVGAYAEKKLTTIVKSSSLGSSMTIGKILHPSPASPAANKGWAEVAERQLVEQGIWK